MTTAIRTPKTSSPEVVTGPATARTGGMSRRPSVGLIALIGLRVAIGFEFFWAFLDKFFGLGYATPSAKAWINGGSPTKGFLSGVSGGPLKGFFHSLAGVTGMDLLFMTGLFAIGAALLLGVALRPAAAAGGLLLMLMWFATWPFATMADGAPSGSTNPIVDDHIISTFALVVIATVAGRGAGVLGRRWSALPLVHAWPWLR